MFLFEIWDIFWKNLYIFFFEKKNPKRLLQKKNLKMFRKKLLEEFPKKHL